MHRFREQAKSILFAIIADDAFSLISCIMKQYSDKVTDSDKEESSTVDLAIKANRQRCAFGVLEQI